LGGLGIFPCTKNTLLLNLLTKSQITLHHFLGERELISDHESLNWLQEVQLKREKMQLKHKTATLLRTEQQDMTQKVKSFDYPQCRITLDSSI